MARKWKPNEDPWWLCKNCAHMPGDPDNWAYHPMCKELCDNYRLHSRGKVATNHEIACLAIDLRKKRKTAKPGDPILPTFDKYRFKNRKFSQKELELLIALYSEQRLMLDRLPYALEFREEIYSLFAREFPVEIAERPFLINGRHEVWRALRNLGKKKLLPPKGNKILPRGRTLGVFDRKHSGERI